MTEKSAEFSPADISWQDGLPYSNLYADRYYSADSAQEESKHVFIEGNDLVRRFQELPNSIDCQFVIAETGFGAGLNFLQSLQFWEKYASKKARLHYISVEKHPISKETLAAIHELWPELRDASKRLLDHYPSLVPGIHQLNLDGRRIQLSLLFGDAQASFDNLLFSGNSGLESSLRKDNHQVDAWFLDGFSPSKNPELWNTDLFRLISLLSKKGTTASSFSSAGLVRRGLESCGFTVEKSKGFGRKREMTRALFDSAAPSKKRATSPWQLSLQSKKREKTALIIGAGLAGCFSAYALKMRGFKVVIVDEAGGPAGASSNNQAVLFPQLSAFSSPFCDFMLRAFLYAIPLYKVFLKQAKLGELTGILQLAYNSKEAAYMQDMESFLKKHPEMGCLLNQQEASNLAGLDLNSGGIYLSQSGWIDTKALCHFLIEQYADNLIQEKVQKIEYVDSLWKIVGMKAEVLILANGHRANQFEQTNFLPLKPIRGQCTSIKSNELLAKLKLPVCAEGYLLPSREGSNHIGASYHLGNQELAIYPADNHLNLAKLGSFSKQFEGPQEIIDEWVGIRATTPDYLPLLGPVPDAAAFVKQYRLFSKNAKAWIPRPGPYLPGLYVCAGFGSKGLVSIPLATELLASQINQEFEVMGRSLAQSLSAARFLRRDIMRGGKIPVAIS